ncbi:MAG: rhodanese-like domain-containing protein [Saprospiraceae bacterium]|nr:rhodanese-like domain-containing protein [Saprospiraceae bacterium]MBK8451392.1 rhodanese-like domain-containing protein [Saprospiraceae bacterium]MBK8483351.1 rhodanese-like domain-containing protein [Saprospiraceae bacterium]MBK9220865.1 rhodanese-like domain-containing protein [Saprospiraceae bacterium]MBK9722290.1 rhodanese-like domain-containing protein [Saprospiraceae bacterium]
MEDITVQELKHKLEQKEDFILIDVREIYEHTDFNIGGELASLQTGLPYKIEELKNKSDQEIIVYCRSGNRSGMAKQMFETAGFKNVRNLLGGMLAWREAFPS